MHGVARNHTDWLPVIDELQKDWHLVLIDHLGHGNSSFAPDVHGTSLVDPSDAYTVSHYASVTSRWLSLREFSSATLLGHSLGAMVALALAATIPERVQGAILEDPPFESMGSEIDTGPYQMQFEGMRRVAALKNLTVHERADALGQVLIPMRGGMVPLSTMRDRESLLYVAECLACVDPEVFTPLVTKRWLSHFAPTEQWRKCRCPVLGLQADPGAGGTWSDADVAMAQEACPTLTINRFNSIGHQIHRTATQQFLESIRRWSADRSA